MLHILDATASPIDLANPIERTHPSLRHCVAWWKGFPSHKGTRWRDLMTWPADGGRHGDLTSIPAGQWSCNRHPCRGGVYLDLANVSGYVNCGVIRPLLGAEELSVAAWAYIDTASGYETIVSDWTDGSAHASFMLAIKNATRKPYIYLRDTAGDTGIAYATDDLTAGWHHLGYSWRAAEPPVFYVDGQPRAITVSNSFSDVDELNTDETATCLGVYGTLGGSVCYFNGQLDDVQLYKRALTAGQFKALHDRSRVGYPGILNRCRRLWRSFRIPPATTYSIQRTGNVTTVLVHTVLTGTVYYHWYLNGVYVGVTRSPRRSFYVADEEQADIEVIDTIDVDFDPVASAPAAYPDRRTLWWVRSVDAAGAESYRVEQQKDGGNWTEVATLDALEGQWTYEYITARLDDLASYAWRVIPVDRAGNDGTAITLDAELVVRTPDAPEYTATFDSGTDRVTFAEP